MTMKTPANVKLVSVSKLMRDLKKFNDEDTSESLVMCLLPDDDDRWCSVTYTALDEDGNLCISIEDEEFDGNFYDVDMLLGELECYDKKTKVYVKGCGYYLSIETFDGGVFEYDDASDCVAFEVSAFGEYEEVVEEDHVAVVADVEEHKGRKKEKGSVGWTIVLAILTLVVAFGLIYNVYAIISGSASSILESAIGGVVCLVLLVINVMTLWNSRNE